MCALSLGGSSGPCAKGLPFQEMFLVPGEGSGALRTEVVLPPLLKGRREKPESSAGVASPLGWDAAVSSEGDMSAVRS